MNTNKFLVGGIIGGVANFLLGWLVWGTLLMNFMNEHTTATGKSAMRGETEMIWWALIVANLVLGFFLSYIVGRAGIKTAGAGASFGAVAGLLMAISIDLFNYAFLDLSDTTGIIVDVLASMVVTAIVCAIIGWFYGRGSAAAA